MARDTKKTIADINARVRSGRSVVAAVEPPQPADASVPVDKKVDVVTSATQKNNVYLPPMPVMMPPSLPKGKKDSD